MSVVLNVPRSHSASASHQNSGHAHPSHAAALAAIKEKAQESEHQAKLRVFGIQLSANLREEGLTVVRHPSTGLSTLVVMETGIRVMDPSRNASVPLQVRFDLSLHKIELVSGKSIVDLDLRRYAPRVKMLFAKVEARLLEENRLGGDLRGSIDKQVTSGSLPEGVKRSSSFGPVRLSTGGYELQVEVVRAITRPDGSGMPSTACVTLHTDAKGLPLCFVSSVFTSERSLTGSRVCSLAGSSFLSDQSAQRALMGQLQAIFPKEYQSMGVR